MLTVILSEIVAAKIDAACSMPARKLAGAAMAAASNRRLMVMPLPDVSATTEVGPFCAREDATASLVRAGVDGIATGPLPGGLPWPAEGEKFVKSSAPSV